MLLSELNFNIGKTAGHNSNILISNIDMKMAQTWINKAEVYLQNIFHLCLLKLIK